MAAGGNTAETKGRQIPIVCPGHTRPLAELQFCKVDDEEEKRTFLVSACHDKMPMLRDGATGDWIGTFAGHKGAVWSCRLDPSGCLAATASGDFSVKVWDAITGKLLWDLPHKHIVKTCDFSPDSKRLATGGHEGVLRIFALPNNDNDNDNDNNNPVEIPHGAVISKCAWVSNDTVLAAGSDGAIRFWNDRAETIHTLHVDAEVRDMEVTRLQQDEREILTVAAGNKVSFFDLRTYELIHAYPMPIHFREEGGASLHPIRGTKFVAGGSDLWVRVFDFETGQQLECHKGHHGPVRCLRYAPNGDTYATGSEDGTVRLWKTDTI